MLSGSASLIGLVFIPLQSIVRQGGCDTFSRHLPEGHPLRPSPRPGDRRVTNRGPCEGSDIACKQREELLLMIEDVVDHTPTVTFVGTIDADSSIINSNALLQKDIDPAILVLHPHLGQRWWEGKPVYPSLDHCRIFWGSFLPGQNSALYTRYQTTTMPKSDWREKSETSPLNCR